MKHDTYSIILILLCAQNYNSFSAQILTGHYYQIEAALDLKSFY